MDKKTQKPVPEVVGKICDYLKNVSAFGMAFPGDREKVAKLIAEHDAAKDAEIERLKQWVSDCQSGMYVNCVYCGHRYGPGDEVPSSMADVLKEHIEQCPKHPMSKLKAENERLRDIIGMIPVEKLLVLIAWLDGEQASGRWPHSSSTAVQDDLHKFVEAAEAAMKGVQ
jgi:hypothetical protein